MATVFEPQKLAWAGVMLVLVEMVALFISISLLPDYTYFLAILVLMLVTTALILLPAFPLKVTFTPSGSSFRIRGPYFGKEMSYSDIDAVEYREVDIGFRIMGVFTWKGPSGGLFKSSELGFYHLAGYGYKPEMKYVLVEYSGGKKFAFNLKSEKDTLEAFEILRKNSFARSSIASELVSSSKRAPMSDEVKEANKRVSRIMLVTSLSAGIALPLVILFLHPDFFTGTVSAIILSIIVPLAVLATYWAWHKKSGLPARYRRNTVTGLALQATLVSVLILVVALVFVPNEVNAELHEDSLSITAPFFDETILYEDISDLYLDTDSEFRRTAGYGGFTVSSGNFNSPQLGDVTYAAYNNVQTKIVVEYDRGILVFNNATEESTLEFYDKLREALGL